MRVVYSEWLVKTASILWVDDIFIDQENVYMFSTLGRWYFYSKYAPNLWIDCLTTTMVRCQQSVWKFNQFLLKFAYRDWNLREFALAHILCTNLKVKTSVSFDSTMVIIVDLKLAYIYMRLHLRWDCFSCVPGKLWYIFIVISSHR